LPTRFRGKHIEEITFIEVLSTEFLCSPRLCFP
jgi:hypothetical protein